MNEAIMKAAGFTEEVERVKAGRCPLCNKEVWDDEFKSDTSRKEFKISGICQSCQDDFFGKE